MAGATIAADAVEVRLHDPGEQYRALFEECPIAYHEVGMDGTLVRVNRAECELLGLSADQMLGRHVASFVAPWLRDVSMAAVERKLRGTQPLIPFEREFVRPDGRMVTVQIQENHMRDAGGNIIGIRTAMLDITERKRKDQELARSNAELEQFAYVASHDLQEPLRMVASYTQLLARRYKGKLGQDADDFIAFAVDGAVRMQHLINDLLAYSRVGTKGGEFRTVDANATLEGAMVNLQAAIRESGAQIHREPLPVIQADPLQLGQLFQNLLGNAIKFRKDAPPEIWVRATESEDCWTFSVRDNGIGLDAKYGDRIFQVFQRLHTKQNYSGTGIGLAICRRVAERHGGKIWVESQPGDGATFFFTFSRKPEATV